MGIKEEINFYAENITDIKKYRMYMQKLGALEIRIKRYLKKEICGEKNIQFTSQDLRSLVIKLEKIHKAMNKSISFIQMEKKYSRRGFIEEKTMKEDGQDLGVRIAHTIILQEQLAYFNHHATLCFFIETQYKNEESKKQKEIAEGDKIFENTISETIKELMEYY